MALEYVYLAFAVVSLGIFLWLPVRRAILIVYLGGWIVLPVGQYPAFDDPTVFPYWVTGLALPSDILLNKAWVIACVVLAGALLKDIRAVGRFRPGIFDLGILGWCLWPLASGAVAVAAVPEPATSALLLAGTWGASWLIGRLWFADVEDRVVLVKGLAWSGVVCLPIAAVEGVTGLSLYGLVWGEHPFRLDGLVRYVGYRPVGFFEHGNQYGIWIAMAAIAAVWLARYAPGRGERRAYLGLAVVIALMSLAAQSVAAFVFMVAAMFMVLALHLRMVAILFGVGVVVIICAAVLHLSGIVPLEWIARETGLGRAMLEAARSVGRGSFFWRLSQDVKNMGTLQETLVLGSSVWDWWRPSNTRPWGLWILLIGQFGLVGFVLSYGVIGFLALKKLLLDQWGNLKPTVRVSVPLALIVVFALLDSGMNAFLYFPALIAAGSIAVSARRPRSAGPAGPFIAG